MNATTMLPTNPTLLPGISSESSLAYFRQFLLREERRRPTPSPDTAGETEIGEGSA